MIDPNNIEQCAMDSAGALGGAYLDEIKKTDLATLSQEEWQTFIRVVCGGYVSNLVDQQAAAAATLARVQTDPTASQMPPQSHGCPWHGDVCEFNCDHKNTAWCVNRRDQELPESKEAFDAMKLEEIAKIGAGL